MAYVSVYKDANYGGPFMRLGQGFFSGDKLMGHSYIGTTPSMTGEELNNQISSIRVPSFFIVSIHESYSISAESRVLIGPREIPDLTVIDMNDKISSILVAPFQGIDSVYFNAGGKALNSAVVVGSDYAVGGLTANIPVGDYDATRLANEGMSLGGTMRSSRIPAGLIAIFYSGSNFNEDQNAIVSVGPTVIDDFQRVGLTAIGSIRVLVGNQSALSSSAAHPMAGSEGLPVYNMSPGFPAADDVRRRFEDSYERPIRAVGGRYPNSTSSRTITAAKPPLEAAKQTKPEKKEDRFPILEVSVLVGLGLVGASLLAK